MLTPEMLIHQQIIYFTAILFLTPILLAIAINL